MLFKVIHTLTLYLLLAHFSYFLKNIWPFSYFFQLIELYLVLNIKALIYLAQAVDLFLKHRPCWTTNSCFSKPNKNEVIILSELLIFQKPNNWRTVVIKILNKWVEKFFILYFPHFYIQTSLDKLYMTCTNLIGLLTMKKQ